MGSSFKLFGRLGNSLIRRYPGEWEPKLQTLSEIDWRRSNSALWEGRALSGGRLSKSGQSVVLTANAIKAHFGLSLVAEEQEIEDAFNRGNNDNISK